MPTKPNKIGGDRNLPEKECRIMIVKMIQKLANKMELQKNSLETRIEKMQEKFNKDLEEIKKSQYIMINAINEIKSTLEGTNSRITEAEDMISEVEDRMVEINESERGNEIPARISIKYEGEINSFTDKQKLRKFSTRKPALQQMLKDLL